MPKNIPTPANIQYFTGYNATETITITPSDTVAIAADGTGNPLGYTSAFLMVTTAGTAAIVDLNGVTRNLAGLTVNQVLPFAVRQVKATGTTAAFLGLIPRY